MQIGSSATLTDVTFRGNTAVGNGGGLYNNGDAVFTNITFDNNAADNGGGMLTHGSPTLTNVTFGGNSAQNYGGGMVVSPGASPTLTNVTFKNNSAGGYGGALFNNSEPVLSNAILWGNSAPEGAQLYSNGKAATINNSVVQDGCPDNSICTDIIKDDPLLGVLANYGGSTKTIPLEPGSSAIDTGDDAVCPATDQRGVPRPQGSHCDIGAYEAAAPAVGAGMYDDTDPAWSYSGTWSTWSGTGPYNNTMHYTNETGATAIFTFQAPAQFTLYFQATANRSDILVSVDGGAPVLVNAYNAGSLWQQTYTSPMYSNSGTHIVTVTTPGNGDYIDVDAIEIK
jgi:predicted outer membrane repeat protein